MHGVSRMEKTRESSGHDFLRMGRIRVEGGGERGSMGQGASGTLRT